MNLHTLNLWAILVAALSAFLVGGLWDAPFCFGAAWKRANGFPSDPPPAGAKVFLLSFLLSLVMALNLAMFLNDAKTTLAWGAHGRIPGRLWLGCHGHRHRFPVRTQTLELCAHQRRLSHRLPDADGCNPRRLALEIPARNRFLANRFSCQVSTTYPK
jgi:hypothetical protein